MSVTLPAAPGAYDRSNEQQTRAQIEREDGRNLKRDEDVRLAQGAKLYVRSPDGTYREVTISNTGVISGGATVAQERAAIGLNPIDNRFINGDNQIDQRNSGAAQTITAGAALAYTIDRWYAYCTGANVTGQRVAGSGADLFRYQFTGAASVTKIGFATRIEARDSADMAGGTATIALETSNSLLTTVTWTAWYANSTDAFGTLASPTRTQIATGTFTVTSSLATYTTTISVPAAATTGIEVEFSVAAQTSGTWVIGKRAIVKGSVWPGFCPRLVQHEQALCERYFLRFGPGGRLAPGFISTATLARFMLSYPRMRVAPTVTASAASDLQAEAGAAAFTGSAVSFPSTTVTAAVVDLTIAGATGGQGALLRDGTGAATLSLSAEL